MNLMRKIVGHTRGGGEMMQPPQDATLGLRHLCKMFEEFRHSPSGVSQKQLEDKLYNMLPLFCKVFGAAPSSDMIEKFGDILHFCSHVSRLMVSEIRRRASNQSTGEALVRLRYTHFVYKPDHPCFRQALFILI
ncbi:hypothetical protein NP493_625g00028 [Ridgeia piscesae]|uniref:Uncharacterized protein n=1 Tax=Ridgeia piscesae TaxID=27915 RepID=A0AAD9KSI0_RIDPI|nr:hypothetical protein NP493_625g00028 [Ridgeia piscesae]